MLHYSSYFFYWHLMYAICTVAEEYIDSITDLKKVCHYFFNLIFNFFLFLMCVLCLAHITCQQ